MAQPKFTVYIQWENEDGDTSYRSPYLLYADNHDAAAQKRLDVLGKPGDYSGLVVTDGDSVRVYTIESPARYLAVAA